MIDIQAQISKRAIELLNIPMNQKNKLILDIGCGTSFSGRSIEEAGHNWIGTDISRSMLNIAVDRQKTRSEYYQYKENKKNENNVNMSNNDNDDDDNESSSSDEDEDDYTGFGDCIESDMGNGLGFRDNIFDGAISVSAVQWLCYANHKHHVPKFRLRKFFTSLYACLKRGTRAIIQLYPETPTQMELITDTAMACGFTG